MKIISYLPFAAMLLTAALAIAAETQHQVPLKGSIQGNEIDTPQGGPPPTTLNVSGSATGIGTHVGQFSFTYHLTVTLANGTATGTARLTAANGDTIDTTVAGSSEIDVHSRCRQHYGNNTITGGTGRFPRGRELYCRTSGKPSHGVHLRFLPWDDFFTRFKALKPSSTLVENRVARL